MTDESQTAALFTQIAVTLLDSHDHQLFANALEPRQGEEAVRFGDAAVQAPMMLGDGSPAAGGAQPRVVEANAEWVEVEEQGRRVRRRRKPQRVLGQRTARTLCQRSAPSRVEPSPAPSAGGVVMGRS